MRSLNLLNYAIRILFLAGCAASVPSEAGGNLLPTADGGPMPTELRRARKNADEANAALRAKGRQVVDVDAALRPTAPQAAATP